MGDSEPVTRPGTPVVDLLHSTATLERATNEHLACYARQMVPGAGPPTWKDLVEWLPECPEDAMSETRKRLSEKLGQDVRGVTAARDGHLIIDTPEGQFEIPVPDLAEIHGPDARGFGLSTLIWGWLHRITAPERRRRQILPEPIRYARAGQAALPMADDGGLPQLGQRTVSRPACLPALEPPPGAVVPALPLTVAAESTAGRGAAITARLWFGCQMALPVDRRYTGSDVRLRFTLREIRDWLWPNGWHRRVHLPMLQRGLRDLYRLSIIYERAEWLLVRPVKLPTEKTSLDDDMLVDVTALPGSGHGPMVDTVPLWQLGAMSGVPWRAWIRLAYLWDEAKWRNGGFRIHASRPEVRRGVGGVILDARGQPVLSRGGKPVKNWTDPRASRTGQMERNPQAGRVPFLDTFDLAHLGFDDAPVRPGTLRARASTTRRWLREMEKLGVVALEWHGGSVRVLEVFRDDSMSSSPLPIADLHNS